MRRRRPPNQPALSIVDEVWTFASMAVVAAGRAIKRNKLRAALTMLGIFIGVAAVITMVAVGDGAKVVGRGANQQPRHQSADCPARRDYRQRRAFGFG